MPTSSKPRVDSTDPPDIRLVVELLGEALSLFDHDRNAARRRIKDACALLRARAESKRSRDQKHAEWKIQDAQEFICDNLGSSLKINDVARSVGLSTSYFSRAFKATVGLSYSEYVTKARLDLAKRLLLTSELPIAEIAYTCGFADQSHLTRLFSRMEGLPPRAWQRMVRDRAMQPLPSPTPKHDQSAVPNAVRKASLV